MLHNTGDKIVRTVADSVNFDFLAHHILIDKNRIFKSASCDDSHIFDDILIGVCDYHILTAENVGRTHKNGVAEVFGSSKSFINVHYSMTCGTWDSALVEEFVKTLSVLCSVDAVSGSTENIYAHFVKIFCELDSSLTAELNNYAVRLFGCDK